MKQILNQYALMMFFIVSLSATSLTLATAPNTSAALPTSKACLDKSKLLTFPPWFRGLQNPDCSIASPTTDGVGGLSGFIWTVVLNIIEMVLQLIGYLSIAFIIVGGFKYMTSAGSSDGMVKARKTIFNAIIGLVLSIASVAIVNVIAGALK